MRKSCVEAVHSLGKQLVQGGHVTHTFQYSSIAMVITGRLVSNLCDLTTQVFTHTFIGINSARLIVVPIIPRTNSNYSKENIL